MRNSSLRRKGLRALFFGAFAGFVLILVEVFGGGAPGAAEAVEAPAPVAGEARAADPLLVGDALARAIAERESGVWIESQGRVEKLLPDDDDGSRHQRFLVGLGGGETILLAHNLDLAPRGEVQVGDAIEFRGRYEWNDQGGVVHWTHRDPHNEIAGGWFKVGGKTFR